MPAAKKRKLEGVSMIAPASNIKAFTKVSKVQVVAKSTSVKTRNVLEAATDTPLDGLNRKRKLLTRDNCMTTDAKSPQKSVFFSAALAPSARETTAVPHPRAPESLSKLHFHDQGIPTPPASQRVSESVGNVTYGCQELPSELQDLVNLHSSFLTALSIHFAHNGLYSPADLRLLCPAVAKAWGKRNVLFDDIRRTLGVLNCSGLSNGLTLLDYSFGRICVEREGLIGCDGSASSILDEKMLNEAFLRNLRTLWFGRSETQLSILEFVDLLPLETIIVSSSVQKGSLLLLTGHRRLKALMAGKKTKEQRGSEKAIAVSAEGTTEKSTLLERLMAKQLLKTTQPPPPTKLELSRTAALYRMEEIVPILQLLTTSTSLGQNRVSFAVPTIVRQLRDSIKTPMSKEEAETCVRLLAIEIAPQWLQMVKIGKLDAVLVNRNNRLRDEDLKERVRRAI